MEGERTGLPAGSRPAARTVARAHSAQTLAHTPQAVRGIFVGQLEDAASAASAASAEGGNARATVVCLTPPPTWEYTKEEDVAKASGEHELGCESHDERFPD